MPRTLPWLKNPASTTNGQQSRVKPASKRQRLLDSSSNAGDEAACTAISPKRQEAINANRTPSTSPPPAPPSIAEMRSGFDADDIYIMVEDEFHACAQQFTKHLHHAEYQRMKKISSQRSVSTINDIARPVDATTIMRAETKKKKEAEAQERKIAGRMEAIRTTAKEKRLNAVGKDDDGDDSEFEMDKEDEPWQGTQLQRFMTTSPKKSLTSLTGLQGAISNTKAAAGLKRPEKKKKNIKTSLPFNSKSTRTPAKLALDEETDDEDDDLDAPVRAPTKVTTSTAVPTRRPESPSTRRAEAKDPPLSLHKKKPPSPPHRPIQRSFLDISLTPAPSDTLSYYKPKEEAPQPTPQPHRKQKMPSQMPSQSDIVRQRLKARREREENERKRSNGGLKLDEIPIFL